MKRAKKEFPEPTKVVKMTWAQKRRGGESSDAVSERRARVPNWNPALELDSLPLSKDASICNFDGGRVGHVANAME